MSEVDQLHLDYNEALSLFRKSVREAVELHAKIRHVPLQGVAPTARLMFARIMLLGANISKLCPTIEGEGIWDFTSIALLARSLFESIMFFRYFVAPAEPDEWLARMLVLHLHDRCERVRLFEKLQKPEDVAGFQGEVLIHREILSNNAFFQRLDIKLQKELLSGFRASILTFNEMADKYATEEGTWAIYQMLSNYTHSYPISFMRNDDRRRDGLSNEKDKVYIPGVVRWLASLIDGAIKGYNEMPNHVRVM
jgi:hypothetical protein